MPRRPAESCAQCRSRKVKCDTSRPQCQNCQRLNFDCTFNRPESSPEPSTLVPERRRGRACLECRSLKVKCPGTVSPCRNCLKRNKECVYPPLRRRAVESSDRFNHDSSDIAVQNPTSIAALSELSLPDTFTSTRLMDAYFATVYPNFWYSFIRRDSLNHVRDPLAADCLRLAVCLITATLQRDTETFPAQTEEWARNLERIMLTKLDSLSLPILQSLILLVRFKVETGAFRGAFMLTAIAARAIFAMRLNYEKPSLPRLAQEVRRRLVWSLSAMEANFAIGVPEITICRQETIHLKLPQSDEAFEHEPLDQNSLDLFGLIIKLKIAREDIMRFSRTVSQRTPAEFLAATADMEKNLADLDSLWRDEDRYSIPRRFHAGNQIHVLTVHLAFNQTYCDVFRLFLAGYREAAPDTILAEIDPATVSTRADRALQHAHSNIEIAKHFTEHCGHLLLCDLDVAICLYHAAQIVTFAARMQPQQIPDAISQVKHCLRFLETFYPMSEFAKPMVRNLERLISSPYLSPDRLPRNERAGSDAASQSGAIDVAEIVPKLSIHSLLRRANFPEAEEEEDDTTSHAVGAVNDEGAEVAEGMMGLDFPFDPWMGWQGNLDPFGYLQLSGDDWY